MVARIALGESRARARRRKRRLVALGLIVAAVLALFGGVVWLVDAPFWQITSVDVVGASDADAAMIQQVGADTLAHPYLHLFSKRNILLYPKQAITAALLVQIPTLSRVEVHATSLHTLAVAVVEQQPVALWCGDASTVFAASCHYLDVHGVAYVPAPTSTPSAFVTYYGALATSSNQFLTPEQFSTLTALVAALGKQGDTSGVVGVAVDTNDDVRLTYADGFSLLFARSADGSDVLKRYALALTASPFVGQPIANVSYLDLRFGDKLYYKLKNTSPK